MVGTNRQDKSTTDTEEKLESMETDFADSKN